MTSPDYTTTHLVAVGAASSPLWLHAVSDQAQLWLPILGALWLVIQAVVYLYETFRKKTDDRKD